jgi:hypothetical protein
MKVYFDRWFVSDRRCEIELEWPSHAGHFPSAAAYSGSHPLAKPGKNR